MTVAPEMNRRRTLAWTAVRLLLGLLLVTAAGLKLAGQNVSAVPQVGWFTLPTVQIAAAEWEIVLGLWLLSGAYRIGAWFAALATFASFAAVSGYLGWIGVTSCGCFGAIHGSPWHAFAVDAVAVAMLAPLGPSIALLRQYAPSERRRLVVNGVVYGAAITGVLALVTAGASFAFSSPDAALAWLRGEQITLDQSYIDFGIGEPGDTLRAVVQVRNWSNRPIQLVGGTSDCSCITTKGLPVTILPKRSASVPIQMRVKGSRPGIVTQVAELWTDDEKQGAVRLRLSCQVR